MPSVSARQHFAAGAWGGTYNGVEDGDPQDYHTVLRRLERAIGSLSNQPGPEITMAWTRLSARRRHALNRAIEAEVADLEDAVRRGREEAAAELRRPQAVPDDDADDLVRRGAAAQA